VSGQLTTFSPEDVNIKFQKRRSVGNSLPDDEKPTQKKKKNLIISIFILLSLLRRKMEAYETTTLLVQYMRPICVFMSPI
jgi:hypothetical protein